MNLELIAQKISPGLILDIGARFGHWADEAHKVWPDAQMFLVEGNFECYRQLHSRSFSFTIAILSDREKQVTFYTLKDCAGATGASYYRENTEFFAPDKTIENRKWTSTLDENCGFLLDGQKPVLLKLDTQGSELDILRGGEQTLSKTSGIVIELAEAEYNEGAPKGAEVDEYLREKGFTPELDLGPITHPTSGQIIQRDWYYART